jgi:hypothetical protein
MNPAEGEKGPTAGGPPPGRWVFISYRRDDADFSFGLSEALKRRLPPGEVFFDQVGIKPGEDFEAKINRTLGGAYLLVAVIGKEWLADLHERAEGNDWVRREIAVALERGIRVIPVLHGDAPHFKDDDLPDDLKPLRRCQTLEIRSRNHIAQDMGVCVDEIVKAADELRPPDPPDPPVPPDPRFWDQRAGRLRGLLALAVSAVLVALVAVLPRLWQPPATDPAHLAYLLNDTCWVHYDPYGMDLDADRVEVYPTAESVAVDLDLVRKAGFTGVCTPSCNGVMAEVPRLAQERGLKVIASVKNPADAAELGRAISAREHVDAYCLGSNQLLATYTVDTLRAAIDRVKRETGRPATTSEYAVRYEADERLAALGDWLFPDAHVTVKDTPTGPPVVDVGRDVEVVMAATRAVLPHAQKTGRPILFRNVTYPHAGATGASRAEQARFFRTLLARLNDPHQGYPVRVGVVVHSVFDCPWKRGKPFEVWDPFSGLLVVDRAAVSTAADVQAAREEDVRSPAVDAILEWHPRRNPAPRPR